MFSMEEEEGSATRPPGPCRGASQRTCSLSESSKSEDEDEDQFILPILDDSAKEICHYLKDLVTTRQLSSSLPKSSFSHRVSPRLAGTFTRFPCSRAHAERLSCLSALLFLKNRRSQSVLLPSCVSGCKQAVPTGGDSGATVGPQCPHCLSFVMFCCKHQGCSRP